MLLYSLYAATHELLYSQTSLSLINSMGLNNSAGVCEKLSDWSGMWWEAEYTGRVKPYDDTHMYQRVIVLIK
jgi:hypothetical protein